MGLMVVLLASSAHANDGSDKTDPEKTEVAEAEAFRLSQEIDKLAARNQWAGVERSYVKALATGATLTFEAHRAGAHSARAVGDITAVRQRLIWANEIREDGEVVDWLWQIDSTYGEVFVAADPGDYELSTVEMPFNPTMASAIQFAIQHVADTGSYVGLLPKGTYHFGDIEVDVLPRVQAVRIDLRSEDSKKKKKKKGG
jgi:hypothetical protein